MTATTAGGSGSAASAVSGDSLSTRNYGNDPRIISIWDTHQTVGFSQLSFPTGHDTTRGWRCGAPAANTVHQLPLGAYLPITPQETITGLISGTSVAGDVEQCSFLTRYDVDKGQNLKHWRDVQSRIEKLTTVEASITSAAGPGYSGTELINADSDLLIANREYAVLGFTSRTRVHLIGITGPDTGNDRIGSPGLLQFEFASQFFKLLSLAHDEPLIPVINSGNKGSTNLFVHTDENAGTFVVTAHLAMLK